MSRSGTRATTVIPGHGTLWLLLIGFVALGLAPRWPTLKRHARRLLCALLVLVMLPVHGLERVTYYHHDPYGSPVAATDESGHLLWRERYAPYGARERQEGPARETQAFTGKAEEAALGLQDFGARWYAPGSGRFISPDPLGFVEGKLHSFNRYAYGNNNPYRYVDPDGRVPVPVLVIIGLVLWGAEQALPQPEVAFNSGEVHSTSFPDLTGALKGVTAAAGVVGVVSRTGRAGIARGFSRGVEHIASFTRCCSHITYTDMK